MEIGFGARSVNNRVRHFVRAIALKLGSQGKARTCPSHDCELPPYSPAIRYLFTSVPRVSDLMPRTEPTCSVATVTLHGSGLRHSPHVPCGAWTSGAR